MKSLRVIAVCVGMWLGASGAQAETITLAADVWCPYNCEADASAPGFMIEIARQAFAKHGITVEYVTMPWEQAIAKTRDGAYTAIVGSSLNDAPDFVFPTIEQGWMSIQFFTDTKSDWNYIGKESLAQVRLGVIAGYVYGATVDSYIQYNKGNEAHVAFASTENALDENVAKLLAGKVDAILEDSHVMAYYLDKNMLADRVRSAGLIPVSDQNNLYIAFSPRDKQAKRYATILSEEMLTMRENGELAKILAPYAVKDWRR